MVKKRAEEPPPTIREYRMKRLASIKAKSIEAKRLASTEEQKHKDAQARLEREWKKASAAAAKQQQYLERQQQSKVEAIHADIALKQASSRRQKTIDDSYQHAQDTAQSIAEAKKELRNTYAGTEPPLGKLPSSPGMEPPLIYMHHVRKMKWLRAM
ncbi:MAG: hypothetical protein SGPRY_011142 [Prymnesium sp.]